MYAMFFPPHAFTTGRQVLAEIANNLPIELSLSHSDAKSGSSTVIDWFWNEPTY